MGPSVTLRARASTRTGPPGDIGTGAGEGYYKSGSNAAGKSTFVGSIGGGRFCSFNGHVFSSSGIASSTKILPVGISSASLCTRTLDSRILPLAANHKGAGRFTVYHRQAVSFLDPTPSQAPSPSPTAPGSTAVQQWESIARQAVTTDPEKRNVVSTVARPLLPSVSAWYPG